MLQHGTTAPDFTLPGTNPSQAETDVSQFALESALEAGPVVLNFYLFDFHPACTENMCDLHDLAWFDLDESVTVFGISTDRSFSHRAFAKAEDLGFALLSDSDGSVAQAYDVLYDEFDGHKQIAKRSVFVLDSGRTIRYAWSTADPSVQPDWSAVKATVDRVKTGDGTT
ncbi:MAG: redoxin domain-containing protein [Halobacteriaceae archaeon]